MEKYCGKPLCGDIVCGRVKVYKRMSAIPCSRMVDDIDNELNRFEFSREKAKEQLREIYERAFSETGGAGAEIFGVHITLLDDDEFVSTVRNRIIADSVIAEYAVSLSEQYFSSILSKAENPHLKSRVNDIQDVCERLIGILSQKQDSDSLVIAPRIIVAEDLLPSDIMKISRDNVLAFVISDGTDNSHMAVLSKIMNITTIIGAEFAIDRIEDGCMSIVNGFSGEVIFDPSPELIEDRKNNTLSNGRDSAAAGTAADECQITAKGGKRIKLFAAIAGVGDIKHVLASGANGIGLYRSEFLCISKNRIPTEEEQFQTYKQILQMMSGKDVIIRTFDFCADKSVDLLNIGKEINPALGYRAIRISLNEPAIFKVQLRALLRASHYGKLSILYPMIISVDEVNQIKKIVDEVKAGLDEDGIPYDEVPQGIMIETPAAAMISDELAKLVDFFCIGTNDLAQYTLAVDRQSTRLCRYYDTHHKAIMKMIQITVRNAQKQGVQVGICGALAEDSELAGQFVEMGIDVFTVPFSCVPSLKTAIIRYLQLRQK